jgi:hypothetical protein
LTRTKWIVREIPEQRIVSDELWRAVEARIETVEELYGQIGSKGGMRGRSKLALFVFRSSKMQ